MSDSIPPRQRLIVFLDGTWNDKDDCTNVLNLFNLVAEGPAPDGLVQSKLYDTGVGTGVLDSVSGGAFGDGLEINVRQAYDWLVENFRDEGLGGRYRADEIFVFGFSRGAYTARSLVGFIARCGLLRRGAPLTVGQLWQGYGELERGKQEENEDLWDRLLKQGRFRQLEELMWDPWLGGGLRDAKAMTLTEQLLVRWSRRVKITFVGVYDTVGAMGLDALAIPGLRGKAGRLHNLRPSSIIGQFRHALAIDEFRSSFAHTPLVEYVSHAAEKPRRQGLEQRWFVGCHANVGGGYGDNGLAQRPLEWMLTESREQGLAVEDAAPRTFDPPEPAPGLPEPRDSFAEFAWPVGPFVLRTKRNYRRILPPDELRAKRGAAGLSSSGPPAPGFSLRSGEVIDDSVWEYAMANEAYAPPNLVECAGRSAAPDPRMQAVAARAVRHDWPSRLGGGYPWLAIWMVLAGVGALVMDGVFLLFPGSAGPRDWVAAAVVVVVAGLVDWGESRLRLKTAAGTGTYWHRALADGLFWTRAITVVLFVAGALGTVGFLFTAGWNSGPGTLEDAFGSVFAMVRRGWLLAPLAILVLLLATLLDSELGEVKSGRSQAAPRPGWGRRFLVGTLWLAAVLGLALALVYLGRSAWNIVEQAGWSPRPTFQLKTSQPADAIAAGRYLFLIAALAYLLRAYFWVGEPLRRANLGAMNALMFKTSGEAVRQALERWQQMLECPFLKPAPSSDATAADQERLRLEHCAETARTAVRAAAREGLWRDLLGFIPAYGVVLVYGLYFAGGTGWRWLAEPWPLWWIVPLAAVLADLVETRAQLSFIGKRGPFVAPPTWQVLTVLVATVLKTAFFAVALGLSVAALCRVGWRVLLDQEAAGGWRGALTATVVLTAIAILVSSGVAALKARREAAR